MSAFGKQIAAIELGLQEPKLRVGNLDSVRTFCDVRDAVQAYWILINGCTPGDVYNIGGKTTMAIREALNMMLEYSTIVPEIVVDPKLYRPSDVTLQIPCITKFTKQTGWEPNIPIEKTFRDLLVYWRDELKRIPGKW